MRNWWNRQMSWWNGYVDSCCEFLDWSRVNFYMIMVLVAALAVSLFYVGRGGE